MPQRPALHDTVAEQLVADAQPVRPLWQPRARLVSWLAFAGFTFAVVAAFGLRASVVPKLGDVVFVLQVVFLLLGGATAAHLALRAAIPGLLLDVEEIVVSVALVVVGLLLALAEPAGPTVSAGEFLARGIQCTCSVLGVAALPCALLLWAQRRGAPVNGRIAGAYAGVAALAFSAAAIRIACPIDERVHLAVWHLGPIVAGVVLSAAAGTRWLDQWDRTPVREHVDRP